VVVVPTRGAGDVPYGQGPMAMALVLTYLTDHNFLLVVIVFLLDRGCVVFFLTLFMCRCHNTGIIRSILTPVLCHLLIPCLSIDVGRKPEEHMAHVFWLFAPHDRKQKNSSLASTA
jgi:hypothetical protein